MFINLNIIWIIFDELTSKITYYNSQNYNKINIPRIYSETKIGIWKDYY